MRDNITDWALEQYHNAYKDDSITKADIFYYVYGMLHHSGYRTKYQAFLVRGLPNIPLAPDFWAFSVAGRKLADLHLNFEAGPRYDLGEPLLPIPDEPKKISFGKKKNPENRGPKHIPDHAVLVVDGQTVYDNLPHTQYIVNGRTPVGWFVDRYKCVQRNESGITNYPLEGKSGEEVRVIIERLVYVGIESDKIIANLPSTFERIDGQSSDENLPALGQQTLDGRMQTRLK